MAEEDYVEPLSGEEIVIDLCAQVAEFLRRDCNLRASDAYQGGYRGSVRVHLELFGMDQVTVETEIPLADGRPQGEPDQVVDAALEIPAEPALNMVRERSDQPVPTMTTEESGQPVVKPRRYVPRNRVVGA